MKILYHHRTGSRDGQAVHIEELTSALAARGHVVTMVGPGATAREEFGAEARLFSSLRKLLPGALAEGLEFAYAGLAYRRLLQVARVFRPDVIYERYNLFLPAGVWARRRLGVPLLLEVNSPLFEERRRFGGLRLTRLARWSEKVTWFGADYVLPVTEVLADVVRAIGVGEERIVVIPNGVDLRRFPERSDSEQAKRRLGLAGRLVLGFTGFVREWHGLDRVLEWMALPGSPRGVQLLVVGDGPARVDLEARARNLGIAPRLTFTGVVEREEVGGYISAFDLALQPAVTPYASPLKLFEYMALGRVIVAPSTRNIREVLEHESSALLFDPSQPQSFRAALERACASPELRRRLGAGARQVILDRDLTWDGNARRVDALMQALVSP